MGQIDLLRVENRLAELANAKYKTEKWKPSDKALEQMQITRNRWNALVAQRSQPTLEEIFTMHLFIGFDIRKLFKPIFEKDHSEKARAKTRKVLDKYINN
jgi:hypothetical protein